jgi:hypothetical protein
LHVHLGKSFSYLFSLFILHNNNHVSPRNLLLSQRFGIVKACRLSLEPIFEKFFCCLAPVLVLVAYKQNFHEIAEKAIYIIIFSVLCSNSLALGIGVSPDKILLSANEKKSVFASNPNDEEIEINVITDCKDIQIEDGTLVIKPHSTASTFVKALPKTTGCDSEITVSVVDNSSDKIGFVPGAVIPLSVKSSIKSYPLYNAIQTQDNKPGPSRVKGILIMSSIVAIGLLVYFAKDILSKSRFRLSH